MTTTMPVLKVEVAFTTAPLNTSPSWTDITSYVRLVDGVDIDRGRVDEFAFDPPGQVTLTLSNRDRRFDPLYTSSPYYPNVLPGKAIRLSCTFNGTTYELFRGFVEGWPQSFARGGMDATVTITAVDSVGYHATTLCTDDPYYAYLQSVATVQSAYRQSDGNTWVDAASASNTAVRIAGTVTPGTALAAGTTATTLDCTAAFFRCAMAAAASGSFSFWVQTTTKGTSGTVLSLIARGDQVYSATINTIGINSSGQIRYVGSDYNPGSYNTVVGATDITDGKPHHVVIVEDITATVPTGIYVDGRLDAVASSGLGLPSAFTLLGGDPTHINFAGSIQDVIATSSALSAAQVLTFYNLGLARLRESTVARLGRLCDDAGWPSAWRSFSTTPRGYVSAITYTGQAFIDAARDVEASEQGRIFAAKDGTLTFYDRYAVQEVSRCNTSQLTFSDTGAAGKADYSSFGFRYDTLAIQNDITVRTPDAEYNARDATSIASYGRHSAVIDTVLADPKQAQDMATGLVWQRKTPLTRTPPMEVILGAPNQTTAVVDKLLALELHDRITTEITPMGVGTQVSLSQQVERISWRIDANGWTMRVSGSPVKPEFFVLGTSALGTGRLGY